MVVAVVVLVVEGCQTGRGAAVAQGHPCEPGRVGRARRKNLNYALKGKNGK